jgi:RimJ/RimL family protein N-acetyltransferase
MIPQLETPRLTLRNYTLDDFAAYAAMRADPRVMQFIGEGDTLGEEDVWVKFLQTIGHWHALGYGTWAVVEKETGELIGNVGFADKKRPPEHPASGGPEMGWLLAADAHGKGYATEAVRAALDWGRNHFGGGQRVVCVISTENAASIRVAEKCGFRQFATATRYGRGRLVFEQILPR